MLVTPQGHHRLPLERGREERLPMLQDVAAHPELVQPKLAEQPPQRLALPLDLGVLYAAVQLLQIDLGGLEQLRDLVGWLVGWSGGWVGGWVWIEGRGV